MLTILYHKIRGFSRLHIVFKDGKVITGFAPVLLPITTWRLWNQPTMRYPSVRKQRFHRLGNEASDPPVTLAKIAMMLRANAGRSILPQNTIPSPRPACSHPQPFPQQEHPAHALADRGRRVLRRHDRARNGEPERRYHHLQHRGAGRRLA